MANDGLAHITRNRYPACPNARRASRTERRSSVFSIWRELPTSGRPHSRGQFLLDTNGALQERTIRRKSFKTNANEYFYSIQIATSTQYKWTLSPSFLPGRQTRKSLVTLNFQLLTLSYARSSQVAGHGSRVTNHESRACLAARRVTNHELPITNHGSSGAKR